MNKVLFCIFYQKDHYDFSSYVENCVGALKYFCPNATVVVLGESDVSGIEIESVALLNSDYSENVMMMLDEAREYASKEGYEYLYLLPARVQFICSPSEFLEHAVSLLEADDGLAMVSCVQPADKMLPTYPLKHKWEMVESDTMSKASTFGFCESGLIKLSTLDKLPFRFGNAAWQALNAWFLSQGMRTYVSSKSCSAWIPWVKVYDKQPKVDFINQQFYLKAKDCEKQMPSWEECCGFSDSSFSHLEEYWQSPEQYTEHFLKSNKLMFYSRRFVHWLLPKKWRYYLLMLSEG